MADNLKFDDPVDAQLEEFFAQNNPQDASTEGTPAEGKEPDIKEAKATEPAEKVDTGKEQKVGEIKTSSPEDTAGSHLQEFNRRYETNFDSEDTLKSSLKRLEELKDLETLVASNQQLSQQLAEIQQRSAQVVETPDPKNFFLNEDEYKRQMILKKFGNDVNPDVLGRIVSTDLKASPDLDILVLGRLLNTPDLEGGYNGAKELVLNGLGIDSDDPGDWDTLIRNKIRETATSIRRDLSKIKDIEIPDWNAKTVETQKQQQQMAAQMEQSKVKWSGLLDSELKDMNKFDVYGQNDKGEKEVIFTFDVGDEFKNTVRQSAMEVMAQAGMEPSGENLEKALEYVEQQFIVNNLSNMIRAAIKDTEVRVSEKIKAEYDNPDVTRKDTTQGSKADEERQRMESWLKEGTGGPAPGSNIFGKQ